MHPSLQFLNIHDYWYGRRHTLIQSVQSIREVPRIKEKLRMVTGVYTLQENRAAFNQNQIDPMCILCRKDDETL